VDADILPLGDAALLVRFGDRIDPALFGRVRAFCASLDEDPVAGTVEVVPAYASVAIYYDPLETDSDRLAAAIRARLDRLAEAPTPQSRSVVIPVCYGGEDGPDLEWLAAQHGMTPDEVVALHSGAVYTVYMIGFTPGFPYLGGLPEELATPRRETPRLAIPAGSVGIAGNQTGVYPLESPGGWHIIGRTPFRLFRPDRDPPSLLRPGDTVRFRPITKQEFDAWQEGETMG
jgi:inhibitor of KinA